ncbi:MAG: hypothetical protein ACXWQ5_21180, partial [Ktedonobacterales bacterium]
PQPAGDRINPAATRAVIDLPLLPGRRWVRVQRMARLLRLVRRHIPASWPTSRPSHHLMVMRGRKTLVTSRRHDEDIHADRATRNDCEPYVTPRLPGLKLAHGDPLIGP